MRLEFIFGQPPFVRESHLNGKKLVPVCSPLARRSFLRIPAFTRPAVDIVNRAPHRFSRTTKRMTRFDAMIVR